MSDPVAEAPIPVAETAIPSLVEPVAKAAPEPIIDRASTMRAAGFTDQEISEWAIRKRQTLKAAGFNDDEINGYIGDRPPKPSPAFFDRAVQGAKLRPDTQPDMLGEITHGVLRGGASLLYDIEDLATLLEKKMGATETGEEDTAALAKRKTASAKAFNAGVPTLDDINGVSDAVHYVLGKAGEAIPAIAGYMVAGVYRMVLLGALGGAVRASEETDGDKGAITAGAAIGAAMAGAPAPFIAGAVGKGMVQSIAAGVAGMGVVGAGQAFLGPIPKAIASGEYVPPSPGQVIESAASSAIAGAVFGGYGGLNRQGHTITGEPVEQAIGGMPVNADFANAARSMVGDRPSPLIYDKLATLWREHGIHPAEVANDAAEDPMVKQQLLSDDPKSLPDKYAERKEPHVEDLTTEKKTEEAAEVPKAVASQERLADAAIKVGDEVFTGANHGEALEAAEKATGKKLSQADMETGWTTSEGKFLNNEQATAFGKETGQLSEDSRFPTSEEINPPTLKEATDEILSQLSVGERPSTARMTWDRFYTAIVDRLNPIRRRVREAIDDEPLIPADDPYKLARLYAGIAGKAERFLSRSTFDFHTYETTGKALKEILSPVSSAEDLNNLRAYGTAVRVLEMEAAGTRTGINPEAAQVVVDAHRERFQPVMDELKTYQKNLAGYLYDSGVLDSERYDVMVNANPLYMPFRQVFKGMLDLVPEFAKASARGASDGRLVIDPLESIIVNTHSALMIAERNAVATKIVNVLSGRAIEGKSSKISIMSDGIREEHDVHADVARAINNLDEGAVNTFFHLIGAPARALRAGATLAPEFVERNFVRDFFDAFINTTRGVFTPVASAKGMYSAIVRDASFDRWLAGGGANAELVSMDRRYLQEDLKELTEQTGLLKHGWNVVRHPIDTLRVISETVERATRIGEFRRIYEKSLADGMDEKEATQAAAYASREITVDFARRGAITQSMNMITAFWNAHIQGIDRAVRAARDDPTGFALRVAVGITAPSALLWYANHDDKRWKDIPDYERDLFWVVMTGKDRPGDPGYEPGHTFHIPKPFAPGVIFGSGLERALDAYNESNPEHITKWLHSVEQGIMLNFVPTIGAPLIDQWADRNSFTGRVLVNDELKRQLPEGQFTPYTTETAKALGRLIGNVPGLRDIGESENATGGPVVRALGTPVYLENYVRAWTGGLGQLALAITDKSLRTAGVVPDPPKPDDTLADIPVVKAFAMRYPSAGAQPLQDFYDEVKRRERYFATWDHLAKAGDAEAAARIAQAGGTDMFVRLAKLKEALGVQAKIIRNTMSDPNMTPTDKRQLIDSTYLQMINSAREANKVMGLK
jgi:hypothetical protein